MATLGSCGCAVVNRVTVSSVPTCQTETGHVARSQVPALPPDKIRRSYGSPPDEIPLRYLRKPPGARIKNVGLSLAIGARSFSISAAGP
jgi:hypothetical protein